MQIIDFNACPKSLRHGTYAGQAGNKDGILYQNEPWIIKYPKSTRSMATQNVNYINSPLSEYLGSHIYEIMDIPVHETRLGIRQNKIVVACKDFRKDNQLLAEMRMIKNAANAELEDILETELHASATGDRVNLNELLLHLQHNELLQQIPDTRKRFWDMVIIDILIDNSDRNNGNWGLLRNLTTGNVTLAPVYDNGNAFSAKTADDKLAQELKRSDIIHVFTGGRTAYEYNGKLLSAKKLLKQNIPELKNALARNVPVIQKRMPDIKDCIAEIPETYESYTICSSIRKAHYLKSMQVRLDALLIPAYMEPTHQNYGKLAEQRLPQFQETKQTDYPYERG